MFETAGAVLAFGTSTAAFAGITIPAGDWTVDIGGNVNAYYTHKSTDNVTGSVTVGSNTYSGSVSGTDLVDGNTVGTGLLPAALGIGAKSRQNDLDIAVQFSFFTGTNAGAGLDNVAGGAAGANNTLNIRQAFLSFGDASWGTIKGGRDLGIYGSDAILSDMTLLGVGVSGTGANAAGGSSTLGRIGSGYIYADWKGQISYTSPNWNGFQFAAAIVEPMSNGVAGATREDMGYEGKATYDFAANDVTGRVWVSGISQEHATGLSNTSDANGYTSRGFDIGAKAAYQGAQLVGYYYDGEGLDSQYSNTTIVGTGGLVYRSGFKTDYNGGYVQGTFVVPGIGTKLGASWGKNISKGTVSSVAGEIENESWILGAYHPLTKSLNLVAEYTNQEITVKGTTGGVTATASRESNTVALGAILFF